MSLILALDGHDGAGKTTLAGRLAEALGGVTIRPYRGSAGELMLWAAESGDERFAADLARRTVDFSLQDLDAPVAVLDRCALTVLSLLHRDRWDHWGPLPPTVLCWADLPTTLRRLARRSEAALPQEYHRRYLRVYRDLAAHLGCPVLRTDRLSEDACLDALLAWAEGRRNDASGASESFFRYLIQLPTALSPK